MRTPEIWLGDEASLESLLKSIELLSKAPPPMPSAKMFAEDEDTDLLDMLADGMSQTNGSVGIVNVSGPLVAEASFWTLLFGGTPYPAVSRAVQRFSENEEVGSILLNLNTSGGDALGLDDLVQNIQVARTAKPVYSWSGGRALSAGYWLASATDRAYGSRMAEFGSIGVISTHVSRARQLKEDGIDVTLIRSGKYKAPAHPAEKLSDSARDIIQAKTDQLYGFFLEHVSKTRGLDLGHKDDWAEGRTMFADEAKSKGLVDEVISLNDLLTRLNSKTQEQSKMPKQVVLTREAAAAVASGASLEQFPHTVEDPAQPEPEAVIEPEVEASSEPEVEATPEKKEEAHVDSELVTFLREELAGERKRAVDLEREAMTAKARADAAESSISQLKQIAVEATSRMMVGLGQTPIDMADLPPDTVASQYQKVKSAFEEKFRIGRTSLSAMEDPKHVDTVPATLAARKAGITKKDHPSEPTSPWGR